MVVSSLKKSQVNQFSLGLSFRDYVDFGFLMDGSKKRKPLRFEFQCSHVNRNNSRNNCCARVLTRGPRFLECERVFKLERPRGELFANVNKTQDGVCRKNERSHVERETPTL